MAFVSKTERLKRRNCVAGIPLAQPWPLALESPSRENTDVGNLTLGTWAMNLQRRSSLRPAMDGSGRYLFGCSQLRWLGSPLSLPQALFISPLSQCGYRKTSVLRSILKAITSFFLRDMRRRLAQQRAIRFRSAALRNEGYHHDNDRNLNALARPSASRVSGRRWEGLLGGVSTNRRVGSSHSASEPITWRCFDDRLRTSADHKDEGMIELVPIVFGHPVA